MRKLRSDGWVQLLSLMVCVSGALTAHGYVTGELFAGPRPLAPALLGTVPGPPGAAPSDRDSGAEQAGRLQTFDIQGRPVFTSPFAKTGLSSLEEVLGARLAKSSPAGADPASGPAASGFGAAPLPSAQSYEIIVPKVKGRWVVDANKAPDADSDSLAQVVASAADGDAILVRPGAYDGELTLAKSLSISGTGASRDEVVIRGRAGQTVWVGGGQSSLKNLSILYQGDASGRVIWVNNGVLELEDAHVGSSGDAGGIEIEDGTLGAVKLLVDSVFAGVVAGKGGQVRLDRSEIRGCKVGVGLMHGSVLAMKDSVLRDNAGYGFIVKASQASIERTKVLDSKDCALAIDANGVVALKSVAFNKNLCGVSFLSGGRLSSLSGDFTDNTQGPLVYKEEYRPLMEVTGSGNRPALWLPAMPGFTAAGAAAAPGINRVGGRTRFRFDVFDSDPLRKRRTP